MGTADAARGHRPCNLWQMRCSEAFAGHVAGPAPEGWAHLAGGPREGRQPVGAVPQRPPGSREAAAQGQPRRNRCQRPRRLIRLQRLLFIRAAAVCRSGFGVRVRRRAGHLHIRAAVAGMCFSRGTAHPPGCATMSGQLAASAKGACNGFHEECTLRPGRRQYAGPCTSSKFQVGSLS